jgi:hypothetical protein
VQHQVGNAVHLRGDFRPRPPPDLLVIELRHAVLDLVHTFPERIGGRGDENFG